jgi:hypothetical protein
MAHMAKTKPVSIAFPHKTLRAVDQLARSDGRSRSQFVTRALDRVIADSTTRSSMDNPDRSDADRRRHQDRDDSPSARPRPAPNAKEGQTLDHELSSISRVKREF